MSAWSRIVEMVEFFRQMMQLEWMAEMRYGLSMITPPFLQHSIPLSGQVTI